MTVASFCKPNCLVVLVHRNLCRIFAETTLTHIQDVFLFSVIGVLCRMTRPETEHMWPSQVTKCGTIFICVRTLFSRWLTYWVSVIRLSYPCKSTELILYNALFSLKNWNRDLIGKLHSNNRVICFVFGHLIAVHNCTIVWQLMFKVCTLEMIAIYRLKSPLEAAQRAAFSGLLLKSNSFADEDMSCELRSFWKWSATQM